MKKYFFTILLLGITVLSFAQTGSTTNNTFIYCEIVGTQRVLSNKVTIEIDYGQHAKLSERQRLRGEDGKPIIFNSMVDAMNWMGSLGWEFCQAYVITTANQNVYHWLLKLNTSKLTQEELEEIMDSLNTEKKR